MAARLKRPSKNENKLLNLQKLELNDVVCTICQSILIEPVTLPCFHCFCHRCFNGSIENNALCCPLCRLRIGSWLRTATKQNNLVNIQLWDFIKSKFSCEIDTKLKGEDINLPEEKPILRLSAPGEIRSEYESELKRLRAELFQIEQKQLLESETLVKQIQKEEQEAQSIYLERIKQDEILAKKLQNDLSCAKDTKSARKPKKKDLTPSTKKNRLKATTIDSYLPKLQSFIKDSPLITDDNTSTSSSTPSTIKPSQTSPEMVPSYGKLLKNLIDKKLKMGTSLWNKENGDKLKKEDKLCSQNEKSNLEDVGTIKTKNGVKSLLVSLPLPQMGLLQHKTNLTEHRNFQTGSVDSMHQELCYFKPIEKTASMSFTTAKSSPLRVPGVRVGPMARTPPPVSTPSRTQYIESLCQLRKLSLDNNLPSAFVIALKILRTKKENLTKCVGNKLKTKKDAPVNVKKNTPSKSKQNAHMNGITKFSAEPTLRRTRSMGSLKDENETTPKKTKIQRKTASDRKPYLRSNSKTINAKNHSPTLISLRNNNNKVNLAVKNLSSPLKNCDVKKILQEQLRIEKIIQQEKNDLELARKMDAEWNGRRQPRRSAVKRQIALTNALRPAKKLKV